MSAVYAWLKPQWAGLRVGEIVVWLDPSARWYLVPLEFGEAFTRQRRITRTERCA